MEKTAGTSQPNPAILLSTVHRQDLLLEYKKSCEQCNYRDQDIDSYPCDRCHTRH